MWTNVGTHIQIHLCVMCNTYVTVSSFLPTCVCVRVSAIYYAHDTVGWTFGRGGGGVGEDSPENRARACIFVVGRP